MNMFEMQGKEYELKITLNSVKYLNSIYDGGAFELIQNAITGDIDTFVSIVHAGLFHTEEGFKIKDVEAEIDKGISEERIDLSYINKISYGVVADSFFYKKTIDKMFAEDKKAQKEIEKMMK